MKDLKVLLTQMKLDKSYEMRVLSEEMILNMVSDINTDRNNLIACVQYYAGTKNWAGKLASKVANMISREDCEDVELVSVKITVGGKLARETLDKLVFGKLQQGEIQNG